MSTYMQKPNEVERKWYVIDAAGKPLGRVAAQAAALLRGKHKTTFTPHVDCGDHVIVINCAQAILTGNKLKNKFHYRFTGYIGNLKATRYDKLLPKNTVGRKSLGRLRAFAGSEHIHQAQNPTNWEM